MHEQVIYDCEKCDYKATKPNILTKNKQSKHEGGVYECDQCDYKGIQQRHLTHHKQTNKHYHYKYDVKESSVT